MNIYMYHDLNYLACQSAFSYTQQPAFNGEKWKILMRSGTSTFMVRLESHFYLDFHCYGWLDINLLFTRTHLNVIFSWVVSFAHENDF